ncbi:MAG: putative Na+/H+ antiporter [Roseibacillus sp.]
MNPVRALLLTAALFLAGMPSLFAAGGDGTPAYPKGGTYELRSDQYAEFPLPLAVYKDAGHTNGDDPEASLWEKLKKRATAQHYFNLIATIIFACAILHAFLTGVFKEMAHRHETDHREKIIREKRTAHDKPHDDARDDVSFRGWFLHTLGEVEAVFGIWVIALGGAIVWCHGIQAGEGFMHGINQLQEYLGHDVSYTEPLFVIIVMAIAATRPIIRLSEQVVNRVAQVFGGSPAAWWFSILTLTPLLGSAITEPAAMTIAALLLGKKFYEFNPSPKFAYATLGLLFVNISVGGTLTHFAAPPVLMVASTWDWDFGFMLANFGWKAILGILVANTLYFFAFRKEFAKLTPPVSQRDMHLPLSWEEREDAIPPAITMVHIVFLGWTVFMAHYPPLFLVGFLLLTGFTEATGHHQNDVKMRTPLLVGFFLAGLVVHGGCQGWWIELLLTSVDNDWFLMIGATILTAFNDNAAVTYLASQAPDLAATAKFAVVAGAVTGGGLTVIANAPNPAGQAILAQYFENGVSPLKLVVGALIPTILLGAAFMLL